VGSFIDVLSFWRLSSRGNAAAIFEIPAEWRENPFILLYQADAHARLGNEAAALACCARLPDDFWTPGMNNTPSGGKAEIAQKLRQIAADARRRRV
jgi:hypothetical protein